MIKNIFCVAVCLCSIFIEAQTKNSANLDNLFNKFESENKAMGIVSVFKNGKEIYQKNLGFANLKTKEKPNKNTKFRIGSITKTFTATIILPVSYTHLTLPTIYSV